MNSELVLPWGVFKDKEIQQIPWRQDNSAHVWD